jgi:DNA invertase Pin-like site-specific DNA recombinase
LNKRPLFRYELARGDAAEKLSKNLVGFKVLTGQGAQIDTTTANGRLVFGIFAALAEFEAELIRERTHGRHGGRPRKMTSTTLRIVMAALADRTTNATEIAAQLGLNRTTLYLYVNGDGTPKARDHALLTSHSPRA